jgi:hypothetical protein
VQAQQQHRQLQEQQDTGRLPTQGTGQQQELDAVDAADVNATAHTVHDQTWPKQRCKALELLQARINEYGQNSSGSKGSSILQLEPELLVSGASAAADSSAYEYDEDEEVWRMLPDAVFVDVYDRLPPAAQG